MCLSLNGFNEDETMNRRGWTLDHLAAIGNGFLDVRSLLPMPSTTGVTEPAPTESNVTILTSTLSTTQAAWMASPQPATSVRIAQTSRSLFAAVASRAGQRVPGKQQNKPSETKQSRILSRKMLFRAMKASETTLYRIFIEPQNRTPGRSTRRFKN